MVHLLTVNPTIKLFFLSYFPQNYFVNTNKFIFCHNLRYIDNLGFVSFLLFTTNLTILQVPLLIFIKHEAS